MAGNEMVCFGTGRGDRVEGGSVKKDSRNCMAFEGCFGNPVEWKRNFLKYMKVILMMSPSNG